MPGLAIPGAGTASQIGANLQAHLTPAGTGFDRAGAEAQLDSGGAGWRTNHEAYQNPDGSWNTRDKAPGSNAAAVASQGGSLGTMPGPGGSETGGAAPDMPSSTNASAMAGLQAAGSGFGMPDTANFLHSDASNAAPGQPLSQTGASGAMDGLQALLTRSRLY